MSQTQSQTYTQKVTSSNLLQSPLTYTNQNLCSTYADNFDLSLLPQDCDTLTLNIPTTVYQYKSTAPTPEIKIEQTWSICESSFYEPMPTNYPTTQHLIPVTNYPQAYPSPQSSPAQSEHCFPQSRFNGAYDSLSSSHTSLYVSSPCPSIDTQSIKQELHILPPSPPESSCEVPSPHTDVKSEPLDADVDSIVSDLTTLLTQQEQDKKHQVLREYLEDNSFQKKHNLKPLALESFIGDLEAAPGDIECVISLALQHAKKEADETCRQLQISHDPSLWTTTQVHAWLQSTIAQFKLPILENLAEKFPEDGAALIQLKQEEFDRRAPEIGNTLHAQLEIWKLACSDSYLDNCSITSDLEPTQTTIQQTTINDENLSSSQQQQQQQQQSQPPAETLWQESLDCLPNMNLNMEEETEDEESMPSTSIGDIDMSVEATNTEIKRAPSSGRTGGSHIHLWQFLKELLAASHVNATAIRWIDRSKGIFKIEDSVRVAKLWGRRKNRPAMNYDKLSRSIRQYYKKGIMKKTERSQRLVYQFCHPYHL